MTAPAPPAVKTFPLVEHFGPTVQGEGPLAGMPTHFLRFGLCGFRCEWCDSMFAVLPELVKAHAEQLSAAQIVERLEAIRVPGTAHPWVTLSGGNPAIHKLNALVAHLQAKGWQLAIETQGDVWQDWLALLQMLVVSPKPPSSGMVSEKHDRLYQRFLGHVEDECLYKQVAVKIVVFDEEDYLWARDQLKLWRHVAHAGLFMSVGTKQPDPDRAEDYLLDVVRQEVCDPMRWLYDRLASDPEAEGIRALPQLHVLAYGHARGV